MTSVSSDIDTARLAAERLFAKFAGADPVKLAEIAWMHGRRHGLDEAMEIIKAPVAKPVYDNTATCQRCGRDVPLASSVPVSSAALLNFRCLNCCSEERTS
jgi:hypothetical protein